MWRAPAILCVGAMLTVSFRSIAWGHAAVEARVDEAGRLLAAANPQIAKLDETRRLRLTEFVVGNTLFVMTHELGHAVIGTFHLPVLGKEEDAADTFATLAMLHVGTDYAQGVLV